MDIENLIKTTLNIPVIDLSKPILPPCATWYKTFEGPELSGNGEVTLLKKALIGIKYNTFPIVNFSYDTNGKSWRGMINFKHIKEDIDVNS